MIPLFKVRHASPDAIGQAVADVFRSGYVTQGPRVDELEERLARGMSYANQRPEVVTTNSCTSALTLALKIAGVSAGTLVLTTPMTCSATNLPILHLGGAPVWCDIDPHTGLIDPEDVRRKQKAFGELRTKAVIGVDWGGMPCALDELAATGLLVIEDAAHSFGAVFKGRPVGNYWPVVTCFSFQAIKHLTTGDGGALVVPKSPGPDRDRPDSIAEYARLLRWFGIDRTPSDGDSRIEQDIFDPGYKFHMCDVAAAIGLANLDTAVDELHERPRVAAIYSEVLDERFLRMRQDPGIQSSWWTYTVLLPRRGQQSEFRKHMAVRGVQVSQVHKRNDEYSVFRPYNSGALPGVTEFSERMMCLPCHGNLSNADAAQVTTAANEFLVQ